MPVYQRIYSYGSLLNIGNIFTLPPYTQYGTCALTAYYSHVFQKYHSRTVPYPSCKSSSSRNHWTSVTPTVDHIEKHWNALTHAAQRNRERNKLKDIEVGLRDMNSVSNSCGPSLRVWVWVQTEPLRDWRAGLSINPNCLLWYDSILHSQPLWIGWVVSRSPSGSIYWFIHGSCICGVLIVSYQNRVFSNH